MSHGIVKNPSGYHSSGKTLKEKANNFGMFIKEYGWSGKWKEDEETKDVDLIATRGNSEQIDIHWYSHIPLQDVWYTYAGESVKCRNVSGVAKIAQALPSPERMRKRLAKRRLLARAAPRRNVVPVPARPSLASAPDSDVENLVEVLATPLPFDKESTLEEVKAILKARRSPTITWINRINSQAYTDVCKTWSRHLRVETNKEGEIIIHFVGNFGFHSVYLNSIIGVS